MIPLCPSPFLCSHSGCNSQSPAFPAGYLRLCSHPDGTRKRRGAWRGPDLPEASDNKQSRSCCLPQESLTQLQIHSSAAPAPAPVAFLCCNTRVQRPPERCRQGGMRPGTQTLRHPDPPIDHRSANRTQGSCSRRPDGTKKPRPSVPVAHTQPRAIHAHAPNPLVPFLGGLSSSCLENLSSLQRC